MLVGFEGLLAKQRYNSLMMLRSLRNPPHPLCCYRDGKWMTVRSDLIVPGDLISISTHRVPDKQGLLTSHMYIVTCYYCV